MGAGFGINHRFAVGHNRKCQSPVCRFRSRKVVLFIIALATLHEKTAKKDDMNGDDGDHRDPHVRRSPARALRERALGNEWTGFIHGLQSVDLR